MHNREPLASSVAVSSENNPWHTVRFFGAIILSVVAVIGTGVGIPLAVHTALRD